MRDSAPARFLAVTVFVSFVFVGFEWVFFVSKPSLLQFAPVAGRLQVLASAPLPLVLAGAALGAVPIALLAFARRPWVRALLVGWATLPAAFLVAGTILLLIENFTYTLFRFTVVSARGFWRPGYAVAFAVVWARALWVLVRWILARASGRLASVIPFVAAALALVALAGAVAGRPIAEAPTERPGSPAARTPDIYLIGIDGVEASHVSGLGYSRPTTPFLDRWMEDALVFENALTNGGETVAAVGSLLTGRLPTHTHVIYRPDVFLGSAAYRHLPGILRTAGYRSISLGMRYYADPFDWNLTAGFDQAIGDRTDEQLATRGPRLLATIVGERSSLFFDESASRLLVRVGHIYGIIRGRNWADEVLDERSGAESSDADRMQQLFRFLEGTRSPVFAHVHLLVTHAARLAPRNRLFAERGHRGKPWDKDDYDDAIRDFDDEFGQLIDWLKARGRYERSLVIVYSDHGRRWSPRERVLMMMRFPGDAPKGRRSENAQLIDVAPTLLEYLKLPTPAWMDGQSLLGKPVSADRPAFFAGTRRGKALLRAPAAAGSKPPFFQMGYVGLALCDHEYSMNVDTGRVTEARIAGHTRPCASPPLTIRAARAALRDHLRLAGYDISGVP